jgi:hypothetical protein
MKLSILAAFATLTAVLAHPQPLPSDIDASTGSTSLSKRAPCNSDACITYFSDNGCTNGLERGSYKPDCSGHCFQYDSFSSIRISASFFIGAGCVAYSDSNCQNRIADSGNVRGRTCMDNLNGAKSMQCYWNC